MTFDEKNNPPECAFCSFCETSRQGSPAPVYAVLAVNPGSTSTKVARFVDEAESWSETIRHTSEELAPFGSVVEQFDFRLSTIQNLLKEHGEEKIDAVVGRGGIIDPLPGGTFRVDRPLVRRLRLGKPWEHASNLGGILAEALAARWDVPAFIVDPVCVDEMMPEARIMGLPDLPKPSFSHALNIKATVRRAARDLNVPWNELRAVVAHMGGGVSIVAHRRGRIVDTSNGTDCGPFSPSRTGGLPVGALVRLAFSGRYDREELKRKIVGQGGLLAYLGTSDLREVRKMIEKGDEKAALVYRAMAWQIAKEIGAQAASMGEKVDAILLTGGIAYDSEFVRLVQECVQWIAPCLIYAGEDEMLALTQGALRVLKGEEEAKNYADYAPKPYLEIGP
ncbi:MAG: butyrate kinase [Synergistaceae bacterium]|jgi:butyrate kinase|nr:butyrate kinase [Synergistaceae bacterium]